MTKQTFTPREKIEIERINNHKSNSKIYPLCSFLSVLSGVSGALLLCCGAIEHLTNSNESEWNQRKEDAKILLLAEAEKIKNLTVNETVNSPSSIQNLAEKNKTYTNLGNSYQAYAQPAKNAMVTSLYFLGVAALGVGGYAMTLAAHNRQTKKTVLLRRGENSRSA